MSERVEDAEAAPATAGESAAEPATESPPPQASPQRGVITALVVVAVIALGWPLVVTRLGILRPPPAPAPTAALNQRLDALEPRLSTADKEAAAMAARLAAAEDKLSKLEPAAPVDLAPLRNEIADLDKRLTALADRVAAAGESAGGSGADEARLAALEKSVARTEEDAATLAQVHEDMTGLKQSVGALSARLDALEARLGSEAEGPRAAAMVVALGQLKQAALSGAPFADELGSLAALAGDDASLAAPLAALQSHAAAGVPEPATLTARFPAVAREALGADQQSRAGNWLDRTLNRLAALVSVRRVGEIEGEGTEARLARAERRLAERRLAAAASEVAALDGAAAQAAADWLADARARLAVENALAALDEAVVARLAAAGNAAR